MNIYKNDVLRKDGRDLVLVDIVRHELTNNQSAVVVHALDETNAVPEVWLREELQQWFEEKQVSQVSRQVLQTGSKAPSASALQARRWALISDIVGRPELYFRSTRHKLLQEHAKAVKSTPEHLLGILRMYWTRGQVRDALNGNYHRCGRIDPEKSHALTLEKKGERGSTQVHFLVPTSECASRGRKPIHFDYEPYNPPAELARQILEVGCEKFLSDEIVSIRKTSDHVLNMLFSEKDADGNPLEDENGDVVLKPLGQRPSFHQIEYRLRKALSDSERYRKRVTRHHFANSHGATLGTALDDCNGPGDVYEIDATIVDCYIVADADEQTILGKCTLYMVIDRYTKLTVGFYLTLGSPSWEGAKLAFLSCFGDWESLCKRLGVVYRPEAFPAQGVRPNRIVADRGEALSLKSNVLCDGMQIEIGNLPAQRATWKGPGVELSFKLTHVVIKDEVPGYHPPRNAIRRQGKDKYEKSACLTLKQLTRVVLEVIQARNLSILAGRILTPAQLLKKLRATPANLWNEGIAELRGIPSRHDYAYAREQLLQTAPATVTQDGIRFMDLFYKFDDILARDWAARASIRGNFPVQVRYSSESTNGILIEDPDNRGALIAAELTSKSAAFKDLSFEEAGYLTREQRALQAQAEESNQRKRIGTGNRIAKVTVPANKAMKEKTKGVGLGPRKRNAAEMRAAQLRANRAQEHDLTGPGSHVGGGDMNSRHQDAGGPSQSQIGSSAARKSSLSNPFSNREQSQATDTLAFILDSIDNS